MVLFCGILWLWNLFPTKSIHNPTEKESQHAQSLGFISPEQSLESINLGTLKLESRGPKETAAGYFERLFHFGKKNGKTAVPCLLQLLNDPDWQVSCAAMRALAVTGTRESLDILSSFIADNYAIEQSAQATIALGGIEDPEVTNMLLRKLDATNKSELKSCILDALSSRPYQESGAFFNQFLASPNIGGEEKGEVLASLGFHQEAPVEMFIPFTKSDDEDIRIGAYEALAARKDSAYGQQLLAQISQESASYVRAKIYEAAGSQKDTLPYQMESLAAQEADPVAKLRAQFAWGRTVGKSPDQQTKMVFDQQAVPELLYQALNNPDPGEQKTALQALAFSRTSNAQEALRQIAERSASPRLAKLASDLAKAPNFPKQ